ncbi:hypothetical protein ARMGADRAFT_1107200 [Armillaria gallica]|uniref:Uncharacterized protein n=1 Tax=Armillaria gallica TaxID=47427 RepID=A0A2H3DSP9_ARMGA|nr:hypothetical protein ARMGADRAFT_1107200 [Armillaria gallica]
MRHEYSKDWWGYMYSHPESSPASIGIATQMFMYCCRVSSGIQWTDNTDIVEKILGLLVQRTPLLKLWDDLAIRGSQSLQMSLDTTENLTGRMFHMLYNIVKYYWGMLDSRKKRYIPMKPQSFRLGDIAEAQCSVVFMKSKGGSIKMKLILRVLALVNCEHVMNVDRERKRDTEHEGYGHGMQKVKQKVRFEYSDEDAEEQPTQKCWEGNKQKATEENGGLQMED